MTDDELESIVAHQFEGRQLVIAEIPELDAAQRPSYYEGAGMNRGSFVRVNDGDQHLTSYEVQLMLAGRGQPVDDEQPVMAADLDDLDTELVEAYIARLRRDRPRVFGDTDDETVLRRTGVAAPTETAARPTLAGLLALGSYPQQYFPQVSLTFVRYPSADGPGADGIRFLDNVHVEGPVPLMVRDALTAIRSNMARRAVVTGAGRTDVWEYPEIALREAITNALVHRDLSPVSRGTQVQVEMYPDRIVVRNPGGLFGPVGLDRLGGDDLVSSARNARLMKILEDVEIPGLGTVCENRGSGIRDMRIALRNAGMRPPELIDRISTFTVTLGNHALVSDDVVAWIRSLGQVGLTESQVIALAILRSGQSLDNLTYRTATSIDSRVATSELQDLVVRGIVEQNGSRRWATYHLADEPARQPLPSRAPRQRADRRAEILRTLGDEELSRAQISERTGLSAGIVTRWLRRLRDSGTVEAVGGGPRSPNLTYRRACADQSYDREQSE